MRTQTMTSPTEFTVPVCSFRRLRASLAVLVTAVLTSCGGGGEITVDPPASAVAVSNPRALPAEYLARQAVAYGPYRTAASANDLANEVIPPSNIKQDMDLLVAGNFRLIRVFDSSDKVAKQTLDVIVDNGLDVKMQLGAFMTAPVREGPPSDSWRASRRPGRRRRRSRGPAARRQRLAGSGMEYRLALG